MPLVSIVTPSYNHAEFLRDRVRSILSQTFTDFEWIIIDDCSTDGSQLLLRELVGNDPRVTLLFHSQNMGMAATTREAIELSSGKYVYRAESDDVCDPRFLQRMVNALELHPGAGFAYCRSLTIDKNGNLWGGLHQAKKDIYWKVPELFRAIVMGTFISGGNIVFRRDAHDAVGGFGVEPFRVACDWHFTLRLSLHYDAIYLSAPLGYHRVHRGNLSSKARKEYDMASLFHESYELLEDVFNAIPEKYSYLIELKPSAMRNITLRSMAPLYVKALLEGKRRLASEIRDGVTRYDPAAIKRLLWFGLGNLGYTQVLRAFRTIYSPLVWRKHRII